MVCRVKTDRNKKFNIYSALTL